MGHELDPHATYLAISDRERLADPDHLGKGRALSRIGSLTAGASVVDLGAGQGWVALQLGAAHHVTAVEPDRSLRREALRRVPYFARRSIGVVDGTAGNVPVPSRTADLVVSVGSSLGYGTVEEDVAAFEEMRRVLKPGASAVVEAMSADGADRLSTRTRSFADGTSATYFPHFDASSQVLRDRQHFRGPNVHGTFAYAMRAYDPGELLMIARSTGLDAVGVFGSFEGRRWRSPDPIVLVLRAPPPKTLLLPKPAR